MPVPFEYTAGLHVGGLPVVMHWLPSERWPLPSLVTWIDGNAPAASSASMQSSCTLVTLLTVYEPLTTLKSGIDKSCVVTVVVSSAPMPPQPAMASAATHAKAIFLS